ncbi:unnamed protein product [Caenorhabditis sp. 36 PRJEB53466]|nr:unnamed protein product [Caenorhabditis sp. 36 PRJEB53466]
MLKLLLLVVVLLTGSASSQVSVTPKYECYWGRCEFGVPKKICLTGFEWSGKADRCILMPGAKKYYCCPTTN